MQLTLLAWRGCVLQQRALMRRSRWERAGCLGCGLQCAATLFFCHAMHLPAFLLHRALHTRTATTCLQGIPAAQFPAQAVLRLLAHAYTVYLMHLTSGGRIAAAAVQKLQLPAIDALAFYR